MDLTDSSLPSPFTYFPSDVHSTPEPINVPTSLPDVQPADAANPTSTECRVQESLLEEVSGLFAGINYLNETEPVEEAAVEEEEEEEEEEEDDDDDDENAQVPASHSDQVFEEVSGNALMSLHAS
jgi:hypothetical protein